MKKYQIVLSTAALVAASALVVLVPQWLKEKPYALHPDDAGVLVAGERIYQAHCASCHGSNLEGQPEWRSRSPEGLLPAPPHDASGHTWHHSDETLFQITKLGVAHVIGDKSYKTTMPIYSGVLSDEQIIAVLSWIKAQWPPDVRKSNESVNDANP